MLQHVVALSFLQLGKHLAGELGRSGLASAVRPAGSWYRGCSYARLAAAASSHKASAAAAAALEAQIKTFTFATGSAPTAEQWEGASLAASPAPATALASLSSAAAKAEAASVASAGGMSGRTAAGLGLGCCTIAAWLAVFATEPHTTAQFWALAIALSPAGAVLRYALSALNGRGPWGADFAWGTCAANLLGSVLSCLAAGSSPRHLAVRLGA